MNGEASTGAAPGFQGRWAGPALAALCGLLAVGLGLLSGELLSAWLSPSVSPLNAVGAVMIDAFPGPVKDWAVANFGTNDKLVFGVTMRVIVALLACAAGVLERRKRGIGVGLVIAIGVLSAAAGASRPDGGTTPAFLGILSGAVAAIVLAVLIERLRAWTDRPRTQTLRSASGTDRRRFLSALGLSAVGVAILAVGTAVAQGAVTGYQNARAALKLPAPKKAAPAPPSDPPVPGIPSWTTPADSFYRIDTALVVPFPDPDTWRLRVTGMVDQEVTMTFAELLAKPLEEHDVTLTCVSNEVGGNLIGNARWLGWPVRELLAEAGVKPGADMVLSTSVDGFTAGTPLAALQDGRAAILAVGMNGQPLPPEHGFPVRMVVPGLYGYVSATKWLTELKVTTFAADSGYWIPRGWSPLGPIKRSSRVDVPRDGQSLHADAVLGGVAWAQGVGVASVEVRIDDGAWRAARLGGDGGADSWRQWWLPLAEAAGGVPGHGKHTVTVRMTGRDGTAQSTDQVPPAPNGSSGLHSVGFTVS
ncbi:MULTISPECIES: molybdopterin-dependent oxidoreductase [Arthrobacter]|uniref:Molybdopterin-dependent oxidoreductase n=2 Tax=Arthrobacter TaxID=1663 RepID=A0ABU9KM90_9MICC|nr:molybdopterin-dependent oxidoreductase [Arthrobacter sp. YJM1]MDP5227840.1 molybdopterin-dependent oxidoreductase [Arthrobacter sp. YJM1]